MSSVPTDAHSVALFPFLGVRANLINHPGRFVARHPRRDRIREGLEARRVQTGLHYPVPVHLQKAYQHLGHQSGDFPVSERIAGECFSLPMYPELTTEQQDRVIDALCETMNEVDPE